MIMPLHLPKMQRMLRHGAAFTAILLRTDEIEGNFVLFSSDCFALVRLVVVVVFSS